MRQRQRKYERGLGTLLTLLIIALAIPRPVFANIDPPVGPTNSLDGNYTITYDADTGSNYCSISLDERASGITSWSIADYDGDGIAVFQNKPSSIYEYRVYADCEDYYGDESWTEISTSIFVQVGETPTVDPLSEQLNYTYQTRLGDINGDSLNDLFVTRTSGGAPGSGALGDFFLLQNSDGTFSSGAAGGSSTNIALGWPMALTGIVRTDINIDGFVDLVISDIDYFISGANTQIVYSSGAIYDDAPQAVVTMTAEIQQFQDDFSSWMDNPNYFVENAVLVEAPGYWEMNYECNWEYTPYEGYELVCDTFPEWVDGEEYLDYSAFNQEALDLAISIGQILAGGGVTISDAIKILEKVFGVKIGGWGFGGWLPGGISLGATDLYSFSLSLESTRNVISGETPSCILNDTGYFQERINNYLEPEDFALRIDEVINQYSLLDLTGSSADPIWTDQTYTYMYGLPVTNAITGDFGFFDARHAVQGYKIGELTSEPAVAVALFEFWWESRQAAKGLCPSAGILEDIVSNHVGAKTAERYNTNPGTKTPGEHMEDILGEWAGLAATRSQALVRLNADGIFP